MMHPRRGPKGALVAIAAVRGVVEDPGLKDTLVIDYSGRITIDAVRDEFYPADLVTDRPVDPGQVARIPPDKVRRCELSSNAFVVTRLDASATPTAVITRRRR
jgi:hypothetical protein